MRSKSPILKEWSEAPRNQIFRCDCVEGLARLPEACIPLVVTSPPYDGIFVYGGHKWNLDVFKKVADQLWRIVAPGGIVCWEVKDQCVKGSFTCTMYDQVLHFKTLGFRLHEKLYIKSTGIAHHKNRYPEQIQEVFVFSKGRPNVIHRIEDRKNATAGDHRKLYRRDKHGIGRSWKSEDSLVPIYGIRTHLWEFQTGFNQTTQDDLKQFPAPMPEQLARDLIRSYSDENDLVLDPFSGSGTTAKMALLEHRDYLGFEVWGEHYRNSLNRLKKAKLQYQQKLDRILAS